MASEKMGKQTETQSANDSPRDGADAQEKGRRSTTTISGALSFTLVFDEGR
jgi:hypothetical protein